MTLVAQNRELFLEALCSSEYPKGPIETDTKGRPSDPNAQGYCAVGLAYVLFCKPGQVAFHDTISNALGLSMLQLRRIQQEWNDSELTFPEIADLVDTQMFTQEAA